MYIFKKRISYKSIYEKYVLLYKFYIKNKKFKKNNNKKILDL